MTLVEVQKPPDGHQEVEARGRGAPEAGQRLVIGLQRGAAHVSIVVRLDALEEVGKLLGLLDVELGGDHLEELLRA